MTEDSATPAIPITRAVFDESEAQAVAEVLRSGWVVQGPRVAEFETGFKRYTALPEAVACTSCTAGLHLALLAEGIGPGDEVVVPSFTWVASANAVLYVGATPVLADVSLDTFNLTAEELERRLTPRTRAVMAVHLFGLAAEMAPIMELARARGLRVIEDAACALGTLYRGRHVGAIGDAAAFSFHPRKAITTGEGGMYTTTDPGRAARVRSLRDHGAAKSDHARHTGKGAALLPVFEMVGYNYRMTDLQAAVGVAQLAKLETVLDARIARAKRYDELLGSIDGLVQPVEPADHRHSYQSYVCRVPVDEISEREVRAAHGFRNAVMHALEEDRIATRQGTHAVHLLGYYARTYGLRPMDYPNAFAADHLSLSLPLYATMTDAEQDRVVDRLGRHWRRTPRPGGR
jgi:perosamine synthetase